ncbi:Helitron helicase-like domain, partial [Cinara cedri]
MIRQDEVNHIVYFRSLFSQFLVDIYAKIETERLNFIRNHQKQLRAENYIHLKDAVGRNDVNATDLGQMVVLPSSFTGGPRYMHERRHPGGVTDNKRTAAGQRGLVNPLQFLEQKEKSLFKDMKIELEALKEVAKRSRAEGIKERIDSVASLFSALARNRSEQRSVAATAPIGPPPVEDESAVTALRREVRESNAQIMKTLGELRSQAVASAGSGNIRDKVKGALAEFTTATAEGPTWTEVMKRNARRKVPAE